MSTCLNELPVAVKVIWAKTPREEGAAFHPLLLHMLDVAAVAETILEYEPPSSVRWLAELLGLPHPKRWVAALCGLHDFGKAIPGFQAKSEEGKQRAKGAGLVFKTSSCLVTNHSCATVGILGKPLGRLLGVEKHWISPLVASIGAHHGFHFRAGEVRDQGRPMAESPEWEKAREALLDIYWRVLSPEGSPDASAEPRLPVVNWLAGLTSAADWIASNEEWFPLGDRGTADLHAYHAHARKLAGRALGVAGWREFMPLLSNEQAAADALLRRMVGRDDVSARPLQVVGERMVRQAQGPALMLVEAPMGEGKTELALMAMLHLQRLNGHRGLFLGLPTQATSNAMFQRVRRFMEAFASTPTDIQLVHGGATLNEDQIQLRGIGDGGSDTLSASAWFAQRRRPLLSPYGVGTIDQTLLATLNVKHHFVRLMGLGNRVVVLDEVHAYDTYTSGLIKCLLRWLKAVNASVVLMSATLPASRRKELLEAWGAADGSGVLDTPYPRVMLADSRGLQPPEHFRARALPSIRVGHLGVAVEDLATCAINKVDGGGCGAIIVNTVNRAQQLYTALKTRLPGNVKLVLFHARFPAGDRRRIENQVVAMFGPEGKRPARALLVATQVVEQSLDLDFDFMITDLAPVDLVLQRAGRLHRHHRERPSAHQEACLHVAGLGERLPDMKTTAWEWVYDGYILGRTWAFLSRERVLNLPADIERLVQAVYEDGDNQLPEDINPEDDERIGVTLCGEHKGRKKNQIRLSNGVVIDPASGLSDAYAGKPHGRDEADDCLGLSNVTRLGEESIVLIPVEVQDGGRWCCGDRTFDPTQSVDRETAGLLYDRQIRVSSRPLVAALLAKDVPAAFQESALLRYCRPLPLVGGVYEAGKVRVRLDDELGLVYERQGD